MTKIDKCRTRINETFREKLKKGFKEKFKCDLVTTFSIIEMALVSHRKNGKLTNHQRAWIETFEAGYLAAMDQVWE